MRRLLAFWLWLAVLLRLGSCRNYSYKKSIFDDSTCPEGWAGPGTAIKCAPGYESVSQTCGNRTCKRCKLPAAPSLGCDEKCSLRQNLAGCYFDLSRIQCPAGFRVKRRNRRSSCGYCKRCWMGWNDPARLNCNRDEDRVIHKNGTCGRCCKSCGSKSVRRSSRSGKSCGKCVKCRKGWANPQTLLCEYGIRMNNQGCGKCRRKPKVEDPDDKFACQQDSDCSPQGCSGQVCASEPVLTTCEFLPEYQCFQKTNCTCNTDTNKCAWKKTEEFLQCQDYFRNVDPPTPTPPGGDPCNSTDDCADPLICIDDSSDLCVPEEPQSSILNEPGECPGVCVQKCGGFIFPRLPPCPSGTMCVDIPNAPPLTTDHYGYCKPRQKCNIDEDCTEMYQKCGKDKYCQEPDSCGGRLGLRCSDPNEVCVDDPRDSCDYVEGSRDCGGICQPKPRQKCNTDQDCDTTEFERCGIDGFCKDAEFCGGFAGFVCSNPDDLCVDDPRDNCDPLKGGADCGGICIAKVSCSKEEPCPPGSKCCLDPNHCNFCVPEPPSLPECGGLKGGICKPGLTCIDDPKDDCDPAEGGVDCGGICVHCNPLPDYPNVVSFFKPDECSRIRLDCPGQGLEFFSNECGCGCKKRITPTVLCGEGLVTRCPVGQVCFDSKFGCFPDDSSCEVSRGECVCNYDDIDFKYLKQDPTSDQCDPTSCDSNKEYSVFFNNTCGCGCKRPPSTPECSGEIGLTCKPGLTCIDDPKDDCDPDNGGSDCGGICVHCNPLPYYPNVVSFFKPDDCSRILLDCPGEGLDFFSNECGCGCKKRITPTVLCGEGMEAKCPDGQVCFDSKYGCFPDDSSCEVKSGECLCNYDDEDFDYFETNPASEECNLFDCSEEGEFFSNACGCGCRMVT